MQTNADHLFRCWTGKYLVVVYLMLHNHSISGFNMEDTVVVKI